MIHVTFTDGSPLPAWAQATAFLLLCSLLVLSGISVGMGMNEETTEPVVGQVELDFREVESEELIASGLCADTDKDGVCDFREVPHCVGEKEQIEPIAIPGCSGMMGVRIQFDNEGSAVGGILMDWTSRIAENGENIEAWATFHIPYAETMLEEH